MIVHLTIPVNNFFADSRMKTSALKKINDAITEHQLQNCNKVILACNTAHLLTADIEDTTGIELTSLIDITKQEISKHRVHRVGLVASPTSIQSGLFESSGVTLVTPHNEQLRRIECIIGAIINGTHHSMFLTELQEILNSLFVKNVEAVILGCTELEMVMQDTIDSRLIRPLHLVTARLISEMNE